MPRYVVLLRGINVGKAKRLAMADFRESLLSLGFEAATTLLNSGNAVVTARKQSTASMSKKIAKTLEENFGFEIPTVVLTAEQLESIVDSFDPPADPASYSKVLVVFSQDSTTLTTLRPISDSIVDAEKFVLTEQAAYLYCPAGILESQAAKMLLGKVAGTITTRNWATVLKLLELVRRDK